jgi:PAS domain-containing protein
MIDHFEKMADSLAIALAQRQADEALRIDQENLQAIFAAAPVGMLLLDETNMIVNSNAVIARLVCRDNAKIIRQRGGSGLGCVHSFEDKRGCGFSPSCGECPLRKGLQQVLQSGKSIHGAEIPYAILIDGREHHLWLNVNAEPVLLNGRKHIVVAIDDITARKQATDLLREKIDELQRFQKLTVGRELVMIELKKEVNELLIKNSLERKYRIIDDGNK